MRKCIMREAALNERVERLANDLDQMKSQLKEVRDEHAEVIRLRRMAKGMLG